MELNDFDSKRDGWYTDRINFTKCNSGLYRYQDRWSYPFFFDINKMNPYLIDNCNIDSDRIHVNTLTFKFANELFIVIFRGSSNGTSHPHYHRFLDRIYIIQNFPNKYIRWTPIQLRYSCPEICHFINDKIYIYKESKFSYYSINNIRNDQPDYYFDKKYEHECDGNEVGFHIETDETSIIKETPCNCDGINFSHYHKQTNIHRIITCTKQNNLKIDVYGDFLCLKFYECMLYLFFENTKDRIIYCVSADGHLYINDDIKYVIPYHICYPQYGPSSAIIFTTSYVHDYHNMKQFSYRHVFCLPTHYKKILINLILIKNHYKNINDKYHILPIWIIFIIMDYLIRL